MLPGTVNGQGVDGVWQAVGPDGKPLTEKAAPAAAPAPPKQAPAKAAPAKAAPAKPPAAAPKVVAPPTKAPAAPPKATPKPTVAPKPTVVRDAPGTSSTD